MRSEAKGEAYVGQTMCSSQLSEDIHLQRLLKETIFNTAFQLGREGKSQTGSLFLANNTLVY